MTKQIQVVEVLGRSDQGITQPYLCRATDGETYYVKGRGAGYASLVKELVAGRLAKSFGLPVAPFEILEMPQRFYQSLPDADLGDLGFGLVFGSRVQVNVSEMTMSDQAFLDAKIMEDILLFDWWVRNGDRTLTEFGGNPNLLWSAEKRNVTVIDFNLAFDATVTRKSIVEDHIFGSLFNTIAGSGGARTEYCRRFGQCLLEWDDIVNAVPERWLYEDDGHSVKIRFEFAEAKSELDRYAAEAFWKS